MTIKTKPATDEYRDGYERIFGGKTAASAVGKNPMIQAALDANRDTTGLCTVRELAAIIVKSGGDRTELTFVDDGMRRNVEIIVTRNEPTL